MWQKQPYSLRKKFDEKDFLCKSCSSFSKKSTHIILIRYPKEIQVNEFTLLMCMYFQGTEITFACFFTYFSGCVTFLKYRVGQ